MLLGRGEEYQYQDCLDAKRPGALTPGEIKGLRRPYYKWIRDWCFWSLDLDPYRLDLAALLKLTEKNVLLAMSEVGSPIRSEILERGYYYNPHIRQRRSFGNFVAKLWIIYCCPVNLYLLKNGKPAYDESPWRLPLNVGARGLVESARWIVKEIYDKSPYDLQRFADDQAEIAANAAISLWKEDYPSGYFDDEEGTCNRWMEDVVEVARTFAKWLDYEWGFEKWIEGWTAGQLDGVPKAVKEQAYSAMVRAQTEQRYIPQPTSFEAPVLRRVPAEVERGEFGAERVKTYLPFVGIGIGLFRVFKG